MVVLTWIFGQNKLVKFTLPYHGMISTQERGLLICGRDLASRSRIEDHWMLFLCSGPHNTSLSNAVKKVTVLKYHPHDVVACDENGHGPSHFQAMGSDGSTMLPCGLVSF